MCIAGIIGKHPSISRLTPLIGEPLSPHSSNPLILPSAVCFFVFFSSLEKGGEKGKFKGRILTGEFL